MYNKNKSGPNIEPCGTPQAILSLPEDFFLWLSSMSLHAVLEPVPRFSAQRRATSEDIAPGIWTWCLVIGYYETASRCLSWGAVWEEGRVITKPIWCGPGDFLFQLAIYHAGRGLQNEGWSLHLASGSTDGRQQGARWQHPPLWGPPAQIEYTWRRLYVLVPRPDPRYHGL